MMPFASRSLTLLETIQSRFKAEGAMKNWVIAAALAMVMTSALYLYLEKEGSVPPFQNPLQAVGMTKKPILVFLVDSRAVVENIRKSVDASRIASTSPNAIALREGRIFAANRSAASVALNQAGWTDRSIEILVAGKSGENRPRTKPRAVTNDDARNAKLDTLMKQDTLSVGEQMFVLQMMNES